MLFDHQTQPSENSVLYSVFRRLVDLT